MKVFNQLLIAILTIASLAACGQEEIHYNDEKASSEVTAGESDLFSQSTSDYVYEPNSIYGLWRSNKIQVQTPEGNYEYTVRVSIRRGTLKAAAMCEYADGEVVVAETESEIRVAQSQIEVFEDVSTLATRADGTHGCKINIYETDTRNSNPIFAENGLIRSFPALGQGIILVKIGN